MNSRTSAFIGIAALNLLLLSTALPARAMSSTTQVAWDGKRAQDISGWPGAAIDLVNDPLRADGWNPWFSEWPNDVNHYEYKIRDTDDVNRLLKSLAAIKATNVILRLNAGKQAEYLGFTTRLAAEKKIAVIFSIGNQPRIDEWFSHLERDETGVRKFGVMRFTNAPTATPPTLTIYAGHEAIDLNQIKIPERVLVISDVERAEKGAEQTVKAINEFMAGRKSPGSKQSPNLSNTAWVESCLRELESIKPGMTRAEVESKLAMDGGLQGVSPVRFVHRDCGYFKVNVEFQFKKNVADQGRAVSSKDDTVIRVSKPYLERPFAD